MDGNLLSYLGPPLDLHTKQCSAFRDTLLPPPPSAPKPIWDNYRPLTKWDRPNLTKTELKNACSPKIRTKCLLQHPLQSRGRNGSDFQCHRYAHPFSDYSQPEEFVDEKFVITVNFDTINSRCYCIFSGRCEILHRFCLISSTIIAVGMREPAKTFSLKSCS